MNDFPRLFNNFHIAEWEERTLNFQSIPTALDWLNGLNSSHFLLVGDSEGSVHTVSVNNIIFTVLSSKKLCENRIRQVRSNPMGNLSVSTAQTTKFVILTHHDPSTGQIISERTPMKIKTEGVALSAAFMEDMITEQNILLIGGRHGIEVVDVETGATFRKYEHSGGVNAIQCRKGCMFQSTSIDGNITLWDVRQSKPIEVYGPVKRSSSTKLCVHAMDASERYLAIAEAGGSLQLNDLQSRKKLPNQKLLDNDIRSLSFSSSCRFLTSSDDSMLFVHNLSEKLTTLTGSRHPYKEIKKIKTVVETSWHPTECLFLARGTDTTLRSYTPLFDDNAK